MFVYTYSVGSAIIIHVKPPIHYISFLLYPLVPKYSPKKDSGKGVFFFALVKGQLPGSQDSKPYGDIINIVKKSYRQEETLI